MRRFIRASVFVVAISAAQLAYPGQAQGTVGKVVVGRLGYQVFVEVLGSVANFPCGTPHPNGYNFAFSTQTSGGKDMLATVLAAKASGATLYFLGNGTCTLDPTIEDTQYVIAM